MASPAGRPAAAVARRRLDLHGVWRSTTPRARAFLVVGAVLVLAGLVLRVTDLVRIGLLVVALPLIAAAVVTRARLRVACARHSDPPLAVAGSAVEVVLTLTNRSLVPTGALQLEDQMPAHLAGQARFTLAGLGGQESRAVVYRLADVRRGRYVTGPLRIRIDDPFGLVEVVRSFTGRSEVLVTPRSEPLSAPGPAVAWDVGDNAGSRSVGAHGAEDASIREYRHGDDLRKIHWRSTARTGTPMVRQDERPWQGRVTVVLDSRRDAHAESPAVEGETPDLRRRDSLEWAVSAAASIADRMLLSSRDTGLLHDGRAGADLPTRTPVANSREVGERLAELTPSPWQDLSRLLSASQVAARESVIVAVLGELDRASLDSLLALSRSGARTGGTLLAVVLDVDSWRRGVAPADAARDGAADGAAARLRAEGWTVGIARHGEDVATVWDRLLRAGGGTGGYDLDAVRTVRW